MKTLVLCKGMLKRAVIERTRYLFESVSYLVALYLLFLLLFFGASALVGDGPAPGDTLSAIVVGYLVWILAMMTYMVTAEEVTQEARAGTLEQLAMTPFGLPAVLSARFVASLLVQSLLISLMLVVMMATSGRWLHLDLPSLTPLFLLTLAGVYGLGIAVSGLALVFKRIQPFLLILQFLFVVMIAAPLDRIAAAKYLPLAWGNELIGRVMIDEIPLWAIPAGDLLFLLAHATGWIAAGLLVFWALERVARERALLGQY